MTDATIFAAGALFTQDCLEEGISQTQAWAATDVDALGGQLNTIYSRFKAAGDPNESTTEMDFIWPVLQAHGWAD